MSLTYQQTENVTLFRRDGEQLTRLHPSTVGAHVTLTKQGGIEGDSLQAELEAIRAELSGLLTETSAMQYKGVLNANGELPTAYEPGWLWKIGAAGTYRGHVCETGDLIIANTKRAGSGNADTDFDVIQGNAERPVSGPESAAADNVAVFGNAEGTRIDDGGVTVSDLEEMIGASQQKWILYSPVLPDTMPEELVDGGLLVSKTTPSGESGEPGWGDMPAYTAESVKIVAASHRAKEDSFTVPDGVTEVLTLVIAPGGKNVIVSHEGGKGGWAAAARVRVSPGEEIRLYAECAAGAGSNPSSFGTYLSCENPRKIPAGEGTAIFGENTLELWRGRAGDGGKGYYNKESDIQTDGGRGGGFYCSTPEEWLDLALNGPEILPKNGEDGTASGRGSNGADLNNMYLGDKTMSNPLSNVYGWGADGSGGSPVNYGGAGLVMVWWVSPAV